MDLQNIIRQHGNSVAVVFKNNGIKSPVNTESLMLHTLLKGDEFIEQVGDQVERDASYTGFGGAGLGNDPGGVFISLPAGNGIDSVKTLEPVTVTASKKKKAIDVKNVLSDFAGILGTYLGAKQAAKTGSAPSTATPTYVMQSGSNAADAGAPAKIKPNYILIAAVVLIVALIIAVAAKKN